MNKQRKVLLTITYNEMGIIIDTKAEEVAQPNLQPTCNNLATDTIERERKKGEWIEQGKQMDINLANAREQYSTLGYPHRNILSLQCSECRMLTLVDESILYDFCPHCGAKMEVEDEQD